MSELVFILGAALVFVNAASNKQLTDIWDLVSNPEIGSKGIPDIRSNVFMLGGELLFIVILSMIASMNRTAGSLTLTLLLALWVVWSMLHVPDMQSFFKTMTGDIPGSSRSTQG